MILDERNEFIAAEDIPAAGTNVIGDQIPLGTLRDIGNGQPVYWYATVIEEAVGGTSVNLQLITDDNAAMTSPAVIAETGVIPVADLIAGSLLTMLSLPLEGTPYEEYLGVQAVVVGAVSAGSLTSGLTLDPHGWRAYPEGVN